MSAIFDRAAKELEQRTFFNDLEARGTIRIAARDAGLDVKAITTDEMVSLVEEILPGELERRGVEDADAVCTAIRNTLLHEPGA